MYKLFITIGRVYVAQLKTPDILDVTLVNSIIEVIVGSIVPMAYQVLTK